MDNVRGHFAAFVAFKTKNQRNIIIYYIYFLKLYNFGLNDIFVGSTISELQHPWISKITKEPKKSRKNRFSGSI